MYNQNEGKPLELKKNQAILMQSTIFFIQSPCSAKLSGYYHDFFSIRFITLDGNTRALSHSSLTLFFVCRMNHVVSCRWAIHKASVVWIASFLFNSFRLTCIKLSLDRFFFGGLIHFKIYFSAWVRWLYEFSAYEKPVCFTLSACIVLLRDSLHVWQKKEMRVCVRFWLLLLPPLRLQLSYCSLYMRDIYCSVHMMLYCVSGNTSFTPFVITK